MPKALLGSSTTRGSGLIYVLTTVYIIACVFFILFLLQSGKGGDVAAAFGGAGSQTAFGPRGAQKPLEKATVVAAALFMLLALLFSLPGMNGPRSVVAERPVTQASPTPAPSKAPAPSTSAPAAATSPSPASTQQPSPSPAKKCSGFSRSGGIGRHVRLRGVWGNPWGFESPLRHHPPKASLLQIDSFRPITTTSEITRARRRGTGRDKPCPYKVAS